MTRTSTVFGDITGNSNDLTDQSYAVAYDPANLDVYLYFYGGQSGGSKILPADPIFGYTATDGTSVVFNTQFGVNTVLAVELIAWDFS